MINDMDNEIFYNKNHKVTLEEKIKYAFGKATLENIDEITEELYEDSKYYNQKNMIMNMYIKAKEKMCNIESEYKYMTYEEMQMQEMQNVTGKTQKEIKRDKKVTNSTKKDTKKR